MAKRHRSRARGFFHDHSLSLSISGVLIFLFLMYTRSDPSTHLGAFFGNAIADWLGTLVFVVATKYFFEAGSIESRRPHPHIHVRIWRLVVRHSLTLVLALTGIGWIVAFAHSDVNGKGGQVVGNIVSEWTQLLGLVVVTKYAREARSKDDR